MNATLPRRRGRVSFVGEELPNRLSRSFSFYLGLLAFARSSGRGSQRAACELDRPANSRTYNDDGGASCQKSRCRASTVSGLNSLRPCAQLFKKPVTRPRSGTRATAPWRL